MDYVDIVFCHRPDLDTPVEETCRAMSWVIDQGLAHYWGTSEHDNEHIQEIYRVCDLYNLHRPVVEQCEYNALQREGLEKHYRVHTEKFKMGTTIWSPPAGGVLAGRYNDGNIPEDSRY